MTTTINTYNMDHKGHAITLASELTILYSKREHVTPDPKAFDYFTCVDLKVATFNAGAWNGVRISIDEEGIIHIFEWRLHSATGNEVTIKGDTTHTAIMANADVYLNKILASN
jgi:hypothetical protein